MNTKNNPQFEARQKVKALLRSGEEVRRQKRVAHGVMELSRGKLELLYNDELAAALPDYLAEDSDDGIDTAQLLIKRLGVASVSVEQDLKLRAIMILSLSMDRIASVGQTELLITLTEMLGRWLEEEEEFIPGYDVVCRQLRNVCGALIAEGKIREVEGIVTTLRKIERGLLEKKRSMRSVAAKTLQQIATPETLDRLFEIFLNNDGALKAVAEQILKKLGEPTVAPALDRLVSMEDEGKSKLLSELLVTSGRTAIRVFERTLAEEPKAKIRCEILRVLAAMHDDGCYPLVEMNLTYPDTKVQREAVDCVFRLGGEAMVERLLKALFQVQDALKNQIIKKLGKLDSLATRDALLTLLDEKVAKKDLRDELLLSSIIVALQPYPDTRALIQLHEFREIVEQHGCSRKLLHLTDDTLLTMESEMRHRRHRMIETENIGYSHDPEALREAKKKTMEIEKEVVALLEESRTKEAAQLLYRCCVEAAQEKDFFTAERLRDRILGADSTAVQMVIDADETINWEKNSRIPASYYKLWKPLRKAIGSQEFEGLYEYLHPEQYQDDEIIVREGERNERLFLIDTGTVSLVCSTGSSKTFLKRILPGTIIGSEQFFDISVWTVTARARTEVELHSLLRQDLAKLESEFPGVTERMQRYCSSSQAVTDLLKMSGGDRRATIRYQVAAMIHTVLVDAYGVPGHRTFVGQLKDISQGGFCYTIGIAKRENARQMLSRHVRFELLFDRDTSMTIEGAVVGIEAVEDRKEIYCVHGRMLEPLSQAEVDQIVKVIG